MVEKEMYERITESVELALKLGKGLITVYELNGMNIFIVKTLLALNVKLVWLKYLPECFLSILLLELVKNVKVLGLTWKLIQN